MVQCTGVQLIPNVDVVHTGAKGPTFAPPAILQAGEKAADEEGIEPKHFGGEAGC